MTDSNPFGVRRADIVDFKPLLEFVVQIQQEDALQTISVAKVARDVERCVTMDSAIAGIIDGPHGIEASVGLVLDQFPYSEEDHLAARWIGTSGSYRERIRTAKRRGYHPDDLGNAATLLRFARWASDQMGVPLIITSLTTDFLASKLDSISRQAPQVGAVFGWGVLPARPFFNQIVRGGWKTDAKARQPSGPDRQSSAGDAVVRNAESPVS